MTCPQPESRITRLHTLLDRMEQGGDQDPGPAEEARHLAAALLADLPTAPAGMEKDTAGLDEALRRMFRIGVFNRSPARRMTPGAACTKRRPPARHGRSPLS